jgi:hypothetical protein
MNRIDLVLDRLDRVKKTGPDTWMACCPAHEDRSASLSIRHADDGKILLHCFAGCSSHEVIGALGLKISDLFPDGGRHAKPESRPFPAADTLRALGFEALVVLSSAKAMLAGKLAPGEVERLGEAVAKIQAGLAAAGVR